MKIRFCFFLFISLALTSYSQQADSLILRSRFSVKFIDVWGKLVKLKMQLSAFGVESDNFPNIDVKIDFKKMKGVCHRSYYDPKYKPDTYYLDSAQVRSIMVLLQNSKLNSLKANYSTDKSDQPTSTTMIYTTEGVYTFKDYGLDGDSPLPELYKLVYRINP